MISASRIEMKVRPLVAIRSKVQAMRRKPKQPLPVTAKNYLMFISKDPDTAPIASRFCNRFYRLF